MPDTGEDREIRRRVNAKEAEVISESKTLLEKVRSSKDRTTAGLRGAKEKKGIVPMKAILTSAEGDRMSKVLPPGTPAPDFTLPVTPGQKLSLRELRGHPVILAFYPADWSPVCGDQMALYNEILPEFQKFGAELAGVSVDGVWCHRAFAEARHLHFPLLADFEPKGGVARAYGAYRGEEGVSERALFVIDKNGIITWSYCSPIAVNPGADGILEALESLPK
jgi:peroxiredoxin